MTPLHLKLMDGEPVEDSDGNRPDIYISIWNEDDDTNIVGGRIVSVTIKSLWGQPTRYIDLTAAEARKFADLLQRAADGAFFRENPP